MAPVEHGGSRVFVPLSVLEFRDRAATYFGDKVGVIDGEHAVHLPRLRGADAPARERARRARHRGRRSGLVHHVQHPPPARGVLRRARGRGGAEPDQHPADAARDRLHPRPRRLEARRLPPRLPAARRGDRPAADDATALRDPGGRARRHRERRVRGAPARAARPSRATRRSTRTGSPSSSTRAARPACPRASR